MTKKYQWIVEAYDELFMADTPEKVIAMVERAEERYYLDRRAPTIVPRRCSYVWDPNDCNRMILTDDPE